MLKRWFGFFASMARTAQWPLAILTCGFIGGGFATASHIPLGWLLGSLVASAAFCCVVDAARFPQPLRYAGQLAIGISAGLSFTPQLLGHVATLLPLILIAVILSIVIGIGLSHLLTRVAGTDRTTSYFASLPGGVAEMANLADRQGGDVATVAVSQTLRILFAVLTIPILSKELGGHEHFKAAADAAPIRALHFVVVSIAAICIAALMTRRKIPNAWLLGGIVAGAALALTSGTYYKIPAAILSLAQVLIGSSLGARLRRHTLQRQKRVVIVSICATAILLVGNVGIGLVISKMTAVGLTTAMLSTSPGGLAEMSLTAIALEADVSVVTAFHLVRTLLVALLSMPIYIALSRLRGRRSASASRHKAV